VRVHPAANDVGKAVAASPAELKPGDRMRDGTIYTGQSPDTGKPMYTTPEDAPLTYTFKEAADYASHLNAVKHLGRDDWRVPTIDELNVLFNNRAAIGGFNESGSYRAGLYWSSSQMYFSGGAWSQQFKDGWCSFERKCDDASLRCVRG
jgi:hypothetical protein